MMKKTLLLLLSVMLFLTTGQAQVITVTESTQVSLLTCSPGPAGYEKFGHTAIRIYDPAESLDLTANWGIFDFDQPGFYYKFVRGETYYMLGIHPTAAFLESYRERNSSVSEQILDLRIDEKSVLIEKIFENYKPENRQYLYNFIHDNCATRPYEMLMDLFDGRSVNSEGAMISRSFRDWVAEYAGANTWMMFGIDLVFGMEADEIATQQQSYFLPEVLASNIDGTKVSSGDGYFRNLVKKKDLLVKKEELEEKHDFSGLYSPLLFFTLLLIIGAFVIRSEHINRQRNRKFDFFLHLALGITGLIITFLMFFSIHPLVNTNLNLLWANPISIITAIYSLQKRKKVLLYLNTLHLFLVIISFFVYISSTQGINIAFIPLLILIFIRSLFFLQARIKWQPKGKSKMRRKRGFYN